MTNEQRASLVAHGFEEHPAVPTRTISVKKIDDELQIDLVKGNQTQWIKLSVEEAASLSTQIAAKLLLWEVK